ARCLVHLRAFYSWPSSVLPPLLYRTPILCLLVGGSERSGRLAWPFRLVGPVRCMRCGIDAELGLQKRSISNPRLEFRMSLCRGAERRRLGYSRPEFCRSPLHWFHSW